MRLALPERGQRFGLPYLSIKPEEIYPLAEITIQLKKFKKLTVQAFFHKSPLPSLPSAFSYILHRAVETATIQTKPAGVYPRTK